jgi:hypothetical protein
VFFLFFFFFFFLSFLLSATSDLEATYVDAFDHDDHNVTQIARTHLLCDETQATL